MIQSSSIDEHASQNIAPFKTTCIYTNLTKYPNILTIIDWIHYFNK